MPRDVYTWERLLCRYLTCVKAWTVPSRYDPLLRGVAHWSQLPCYRNSGHKVKIQLAVAAYEENRSTARKKNKSGYPSSSICLLLAVLHEQHPAVNLLACACRRYVPRHEDGSRKTDRSPQSRYSSNKSREMWSDDEAYGIFDNIPLLQHYSRANLGLARRLSSTPVGTFFLKRDS